MIPKKPIVQTVAAEAKYADRSPQITFTPSTLQLSPDVSHSLSGTHLRDRHAARTWMARARFVTAPKRVITKDADLLYWSMVSTFTQMKVRSKKYYLEG